MHGERDDSGTRAGAAFVFVLYLVSRCFFLHAAGPPDGDSQQIALGLMQGAVEGSGMAATRAYGVSFSQGVYWAMGALSPLYRGDPHALFNLMSAVALLAGCLGQLAIYGLLRKLWGASSAIFGSLVWLFAPGWWELTTYFHPTPVAFSLLVGALWVFAGTVDAEDGIPRWRIGVSALLYAMAIAVRADTILFALAFPALAWYRRVPWPRSAVAMIPPTAAVVAFLALAPRTGSAAADGGVQALASKVLSVIQPALSTVVKKVVILALGAGPLTAVAIFVAVLIAMRRGGRREVGFAMACAVPGLLLWLQVAGPFRHLLAATFFLTLPLASIAATWPVKRACLAGLALAVANGAIGLAVAGPILDRATFGYRFEAGERRWTWRVPIGDWFTNHAAAVHAVKREALTARWLIEHTREEPRILVVAQSPYREELELVARFGPYPIDVEWAGSALQITHRPPGAEITFLMGDPPYVNPALAQASRAGRFTGYSFLVPPGQEPIEPYSVPAGAHRIEVPGAAPR